MSEWITISGKFLFLIVAVIAGAWLWANARYRNGMADAETAWADIASRQTETADRYTPEMVRDLPEVAQRYLNHAIAPGTPLLRKAELEMAGEFLLGEPGAQKTFAMLARQVLAPPHEFVWIARMSSGPVRISGSDGLHHRHGWTRFWMLHSLPLVQLAATADLDRAAAARPAIEAIWAPATMLPANGASWVQTGPDTADVTFGTEAEAITITLRINADGALKEIWTMRWSDSNVEKTYKIQPFGATIQAEDNYNGFTIPSRVTVGNHFGTDHFLPFFIARLTHVRHF
ncbi:hypothetical protein SAMN04488515_2713 [Cognatiyoonia koreensis]|uniref:Uncharacterized protein n=1 Tax=Cognatiyoonia koreensis TaxID=364200 RepID=A0A1I0RHT0_9RHOB|nr:DUF6544 family protein [Cognatiyoonia koreensis]SEW40484.1 hypothetical protein SAMN04488515_2713 [Cognatiyoonia koreensis]